ncbi:MAG: tail fiber domain-containing protein [Elusimicrobia bacterium]|nr:tail fiber domain-containing protein [Elusimicrobiota bacterium]
MSNKTGVFGLFLLLTWPLSAEEVRVVTQYPSPLGVYKNIRTVGDTFLAVTGGNVGVGTASPLTKLDVYGASPMVSIRHNATTDWAYLRFYQASTLQGDIIAYGSATGLPNSLSIINYTATGPLVFATAGIERIRITSSGNVGIGTTSPSAPLAIYSGLNTANDNGLRICNTVAGDTNCSHFHWGTNKDVYIRSGSASGRVIVQDTGGNLGVGTAAPSNKLHVYSSAGWDGIRLAGGTAATGINIMMSNNNNYAYHLGVTGSANAASPNAFSIWNNNTSSFPMLIKSNGNVGVGTTNPWGRLEVASDGAGTGSAILTIHNTNNGLAGLYFRHDNSGSATWTLQATDPSGPADGKMVVLASGARDFGISINGSERLSILSGGNVGIGDTSPDYKLEVNGSAGKPGGGSWSDSSDARLKKNIKPLEGSLDKILQLKGVNYEWKEPGKHGNLTGARMGMIAQDVEKVFPQWVGVDSQGYRTLTFMGFEALTTEAVRELNDKVKKLSEENEALKLRLDKMEKRTAGR